MLARKLLVLNEYMDFAARYLSAPVKQSEGTINYECGI